MRLLYVVQRYGAEVAGGAERHCRLFATHMAGRGHDVEVLTTCARSYLDWANAYPAGTADVDGVAVHRLPTRRPRDLELFGPLNGRVTWGRKPVALHLQEEWMRAQGPDVAGLGPWLDEAAPRFDVVVFFTYLYATTRDGLPRVAGRVPTVLHPTAHEEPPLSLPLFDAVFRLPDAFAFSTEEERDLVEGRFRLSRPSAVVGIGFDVDGPGDGAGFRRAFGLGDAPYLVVVGRVDPAKGSDELFAFFVAYKDRHPGPLRLVVVGEPVSAPPDHPDVVVTGFVDEATKRGAVDGAVALVQPSYFESFSMVLAEAWAQGRGALVQGRCTVLAGQARRSGGALPYRGYAEFEAAVELVISDPALAEALGRAGRRYVASQLTWDVVLGRYEELLDRVATAPARP
ncbi:MAG TPA: glycosyltransferase family 4 protein [Acidimicrobiales bacterium]|nr:glycosyltransferase family 4 protein [Acidimicrobiales bacterium]